MSLQLIKIEEGLCSGEVLFHEFGKFSCHYFYTLNNKNTTCNRFTAVFPAYAGGVGRRLPIAVSSIINCHGRYLDALPGTNLFCQGRTYKATSGSSLTS